MKKKIILFLFIFVSNCLAQYVPQFLTQPPVGYQINLAHPDAQNLFGLWILNESSGGTIYDLSRNGHDGILTNMDSGTDWVAGRDGSALDFDGTDDFIDFGAGADAYNPGTKSMSVVQWIFIRDTGGGDVWRGLQKRGTGAAADQAGWQVSGGDGTGDMANTTWADGGGNSVAISSTDYGVGSSTGWLQIVVTWNNPAGELKLYLNGVFKETGANTGTPAGMNITTARNMTFGCSWQISQNQHLDGIGSYMSIYDDRVLTLQDVWSLYIYPYAMWEQPPGRILAAAAAAAAVERRRFIRVNDD